MTGWPVEGLKHHGGKWAKVGTSGTTPNAWLNHASSEDGFILIIVIWTLVLVSFMVLAFSRSVQSYVREASALAESASAEASADGGISVVALDITRSRQLNGAPRFPHNGNAVFCKLADGVVLRLAVQDSGGLIDLNLATDPLLTALIVGLGVAPELAKRQVARIIDFRDRDVIPEPDGAELAEYLAQGRSLGPKNAPFEAIEELSQVLGIDPGLIRSMRQFITLDGSGGLDPETIPRALEAIIDRGLDAMGRPELAGGRWRSDPDLAVSSNRSTILVLSAARLQGGAQFVREAVLDFGRAGNGIPALKRWSRGHLTDEDRAELAAAEGVPPC
jgi:general secretion pathway protein K